MDLLIKHGTWVVIPAGLALAFVYTYVYGKVYPFLIARSLEREDERKRAVPIMRIVLDRKAAPARPAPERAKVS